MKDQKRTRTTASLGAAIGVRAAKRAVNEASAIGRELGLLKSQTVGGRSAIDLRLRLR